MNKLWTLLLFCLSLAVVLVVADIQIAEANVTATIDYQDFNDDAQRTLSENMQFTLRNTAAEAVTVKVSIDDLLSGYSTTSIADVAVPGNNGTAAVTFTLSVPHKQSAGSVKVGTIVVKDANNLELLRKDFLQETKSMLELDRLQVGYVSKEGRNEEDKFDGEDTGEFKLDEKVAPGTEMTLSFRLKNRFDDNYDKDKAILEGFEIKVEPDDNDLLHADVEDTFDVDDLKASEERTVDIKLQIDEEVDEGDYEIELTLEAEDGKNVKYKIEKKVSLGIERKREDVRITKASVQPATITACDTEFFVQMELKNFGTRDQPLTGLSIFNERLGINENVQDISLDSYQDDDNTFSRTFRYTLKTGTTTGTYPLDVKAYIKKTEQMDSERVDVIIQSCPKPVEAPKSPAQPSAETPAPPVQPSTQPGPSVPGTARGTVSAPPAPSGTTLPSAPPTGAVTTHAVTIENPYTMEDVFVGLFIVVIVVLVVLIMIFVVHLLR